jgi:O-antigen ligase
MTYLTVAAAPLILALAWLSVRRPVVGGSLLLFILYTRFSDVGISYHGLPSIAQPLVLLLGGALFVRRTAMGGARGLANITGIWSAAALYLAVLFASAIWAPNANAAVQDGINLLKNLLIVYVIAETFETPRSLRLGIWVLIGAGVVLAGLSVLQALTHTYGNSYFGLAQAPIRQITTGANGERSSGPIGDPNFYSLILAALIPFVLIRLRDEKTLLLRSAALVALGLLLAAQVLTYSRGGLIAVLIMAVFYVPLARVRPRHLALGVLVVLPLLSLVPSAYWQRLALLGTGISGSGQVDMSVQKRAASQQIALEMFADNPIGGVGAANYPDTYFHYALQLDSPDAANYAHDLYLQIGAETGLLGLVTFGASMLLVMRAVWRRRALAARLGDRMTEGLTTSCLLSLATYLIGSAFLPAAYPRYLWILVGLAVAAALCGRQAVIRREWQIPALGRAA